MIAAAPPQMQFDLRLAHENGLRMVNITTLRDIYPGGHSLQFFTDLIELRDIAWAWHIERASSVRREFRIWWGEIEQMIDANGSSGTFKLEEVIYDILPPLEGRLEKFVTVTGKQLQERFSCSPGLIQDLIADGELRVTRDPAYPAESPVISYPSAVEFLKRRKL